MSIPERYFRATGQTVGQAVVEMHERGFSISRASDIIGYCSSSDLRRYLKVRGIECPWPVVEKRSRGKPPIRITDDVMERFVALRKLGTPAQKAAEIVGHSLKSIRNGIAKRRPDLQRRGKYKGDKYKFA